MNAPILGDGTGIDVGRVRSIARLNTERNVRRLNIEMRHTLSVHELDGGDELVNAFAEGRERERCLWAAPCGSERESVIR